MGTVFRRERRRDLTYAMVSAHIGALITVDQATRDLLASAFTVYGPIGVFVLALGLAAFLAFRYVATKWLDRKFAEQLEGFKHQQNKDIEEYKYKVNSLFDRSVRLHQNEFETLPEAWRKAVEAFYRAQQATSGLKSYAAVSGMQETKLRTILDRMSFTQDVIDDIIRAPDIQAEYVKRLDLLELSEADSKIREFRIYLKQYGIFIRPEIESKFEQLDNLINRAMSTSFVPRIEA